MRVNPGISMCAAVAATGASALVAHALMDAPSQAPRAADGVRTDTRTRLPGMVRFLATEPQAWAGAAAIRLRELLGTHRPAGDATTQAARAANSWASLQRSMAVPGDHGAYFMHPHGGVIASSVWPHGQALAAGLDVARLTGDYGAVDDLVQRLSLYESHGSYEPEISGTPLGGRRFWDDNAWIGLDLVQAYAQTGDRSYLARTEAMWPMFLRGMTADGGMHWREGDRSVNTCSTAPTLQLALRLYRATGKQTYLDAAHRLDSYLQSRLRRDDGLFADLVRADGTRDDHVYSYNQGTALGADVQWFAVTGDRTYLARARATGDAAVRYFSRHDRLWKEAPAFNAILFRNLLALDEALGSDRYRPWIDAYAHRAWNEARDPSTGLFNRGGIGAYGNSTSGNLIDQAAFAQTYALLGWPRGELARVS